MHVEEIPEDYAHQMIGCQTNDSHEYNLARIDMTTSTGALEEMDSLVIWESSEDSIQENRFPLHCVLYQGEYEDPGKPVLRSQWTAHEIRESFVSMECHKNVPNMWYKVRKMMYTR